VQKKGKVVDLEGDEGMEDIDAQGVDPILKLLEFIPPSQGKVKVLKDPDERQFLLNTPLLLENITFEGLCLACIPHLKLEDWDLEDMERFPHLATDTFMKCVIYREFGVTALEPVKWIRGVNNARLLNLLWVSHYPHAPINLIFIKQLLCLVHGGCLWLGELIPITNMLIHRITLLPHSRLIPTKAFGGKMGECYLDEKMKDKFKLLGNYKL